MTTQRQFCTFWLDGLYFGIEVQKIQEVLRYQEMTRVPLAPVVVRGLLNLRGQIVAALDLRRCLELRDRPSEQQPFNVVVHSAHGPVSFLVDQIGEVLSVPEAAFEPSPNTLRGVGRQLIGGAYKLADRLLLVLDPDMVLQGVA